MSKKAFAAHIKSATKKTRRVGNSGCESSIPQMDHTERQAIIDRLKKDQK